jgi:hypothetical protein
VVKECVLKEFMPISSNLIKINVVEMGKKISSPITKDSSGNMRCQNEVTEE